MRTMSGSDVVRLWEALEGRSHTERALLLLAHAYPNATLDEVARLPVGQRDSRLFTLREAMLGKHVQAHADCPSCAQRLDVQLNTSDFCTAPSRNDTATELQHGDYLLQFRAPSSLDLLAVSGVADRDMALRQLLTRCVVASDAGQAIDPASLPAPVIERLASAMSDGDPQGELLIELHCPSCHAEPQFLFDVALFYFSELAALAKRLLREVHTLATAYGWSEASILAMSNRRRQSYLQMVGT